MKQRTYRVVITEPVQEWIDGLLKYSCKLDVNELSRVEKDIVKVYDAIFSLERYPYRIKCVEAEYAAYGIR